MEYGLLSMSSVLEKNYMRRDLTSDERHFLSIGLVRTDFGQQFAEVRRVHGQRVTVAFPAC